MASPRRKNRQRQIKPDAYRVGETVTKERASKLGGIVERPLAYANSGKIVHRRQEAKIECTLDMYRIRSDISDQQHEAGIMFRWAYHAGARTIQVAEPDWTRVDGGIGPSGIDKPTIARRRMQAARAALTAEQWVVVETVAGWDALAGGTRRLNNLRAALDELFRLWF